jgi:hypothetical protein
MCRISEFNLSQTSLTSPVTLTALRELPNTNPTLYREITGGKGDESADLEKNFIEGNDDLVEDGTDIPVDVIVAQIISGNSILVEGFKCDNEGVIVRTGVAEETEVVHDEFVSNGDSIKAAPLGRGHRAKLVPSRYGTNAAWEEY